jgi:hypothetical protein
MICRRPILWVFWVGLLVAREEVVALGQSHARVDVAVGYVRSWGTVFDGWPAAFSLGQDPPKRSQGWTVSATRHLPSLFGLTGEVAGTYLPIPDYGGRGSHLLLQHHSVMAGPTLGASTSRRVRPYVSVLGGVTVLTFAAYGESTHTSYPSLQEAAGLDLTLSKRAAARLEVSQRQARDDAPDVDLASSTRAAVSLVYRF